VQVGLPPGVGSDYDRIEVLGGGVSVRLTRAVTIVAFSPQEDPEYADQAVVRCLLVIGCLIYCESAAYHRGGIEK
jgi:hypothetical protein